MGAGEGVEQGGLTRERVDVVDAGDALALVPRHLGRFGVAQLDPHRRYPRRGHAGEQARLEAGARLRLFRGHPGGIGAHHDEPFELSELPVEGAQQAAADAAEELLVHARPATDELPAGEFAEFVHQRRIGDERRVVGPGRHLRETGQIQRLAHRRDHRQIPTGPGDRFAHEAVHMIGGAAEEHQPDVASGQQFVNGERVEVVGERFLGAQLSLQLPGPPLRPVHFRFEVVDDAVLGG